MGSPTKYVGIHRKQVFHWIAAPLDRKKGLAGPISDEIRANYIECLRSSLQHGIWLRIPRERERIKLNNYSVYLDLPIACFTEWALGESTRHTRVYGRMGLGFPKAWLVRNGGQPVTYFDHSQRGAFLKSAVKLLKGLQDQKSLLEELLFLLHYTKRVHRPVSPSRGNLGAPQRQVRDGGALAGTKANAFVRSWSKVMPFLEEREWRIVARRDGKFPRQLEQGPKGDIPQYYLPYSPGRDMFTLVLPDNQTVNEVVTCPHFARVLFPDDAPHVTVLSLEDLGTF
jgi:hypothetical protein